MCKSMQLIDVEFDGSDFNCLSKIDLVEFGYGFVSLDEHSNKLMSSHIWVDASDSSKFYTFVGKHDVPAELESIGNKFYRSVKLMHTYYDASFIEERMPTIWERISW